MMSTSSNQCERWTGRVTAKPVTSVNFSGERIDIVLPLYRAVAPRLLQFPRPEAPVGRRPVRVDAGASRPAGSMPADPGSRVPDPRPPTPPPPRLLAGLLQERGGIDQHPGHPPGGHQAA